MTDEILSRSPNDRYRSGSEISVASALFEKLGTEHGHEYQLIHDGAKKANFHADKRSFIRDSRLLLKYVVDYSLTLFTQELFRCLVHSLVVSVPCRAFAVEVPHYSPICSKLRFLLLLDRFWSAFSGRATIFCTIH